jgi:hypothetical protein
MREKIKNISKVRWSNGERETIFLLFLTPKKEKKTLEEKVQKIVV